MEGIIVIAVVLFVFRILFRGMMAASQSGPKKWPGEAQPGGQPRPPYRPPLTPAARPGEGAAPDWSDIMTMLGGADTQSRQPTGMEGESTEALSPSGSLTAPSMMEGDPSAPEGYGMMDGSLPRMEAGQPGYEGAASPGASATAATAPMPVPETPAVPLRPAARPGRHDPAALRGAVVWAEILAKPKALRRVVR